MSLPHAQQQQNHRHNTGSAPEHADFMSPSDSTAARDWTLDLPQTPHVQFFRNVDWAATDLGPTATWSTALRMYTHMVMSDSRAATLYW
ncbi:hypothetical protein P154DRAFT_523613 [Amniculicola lignicola CBS 123094]|uniref:Uncharacterized protein n=1 Tax=Amniculicola lignicola CBS 123094 TaxID=1392246 RepID=A0A6A5WAS3_9PLEO|nr:hypothetical protein P154DRAFT_523613 [Amniculicola lignicola CBS 123094]